MSRPMNADGQPDWTDGGIHPGCARASCLAVVLFWVAVAVAVWLVAC